MEHFIDGMGGVKDAAAVEIDGYAGQLSEDHPGFKDQAYVERRAFIASIAADYRRGEPIPHAPYTDEEHAVWALVSKELFEKHRIYGTKAVVEGSERLNLPKDRVPQLDEVSELLYPLTGFRYEPVAGLVAPVDFYGSLADSYFRSTQYIRHASAPRYTPEPDVIHEVVGHATKMADDDFARLYRKFGVAVRRCETDDAIRFLSRVFWFTMEFGVLMEDGEPKAYGAGLLSSYGELEEFRTVATLHPWDLVRMGTTKYDITKYQVDLFLAESMQHLDDEIEAFLEDYDDDKAARMIALSPTGMAA